MTQSKFFTRRLKAALALLAVFALVAGPVKAAPLTSMSDVMNRQKIGVASNHTITFTTPTGVDALSDTITLDFTGFTLGSVAFGDIDLTHGPSTGAETSETLAAAAAAGTWGISAAGVVITLTPPTDAAAGEIAANDIVIVTIGTNASGGANQITNPASAGAYAVRLAGNFGDTGGIGAPIQADDQVAVTATVLPPSSTPPIFPPGGGPPQDTTPPVISNVQGTPTSPTTATVTWQTDEASNSSVSYGNDASYASGTVSNSQLVTSHSVDLTGLIPCSTHHFQVTSADAVGNSAASGDYTFTMPCDTTPPVISNVQAVNITDTGAVIQWNTDEPATSLVEYGTDASYGNTATAQGLVTSHNVPINGLAPGTTYHFRVISQDAYGNTSVSGDYAFTTLQDSTPPGNVTLTATAGDAQVQLDWTIPLDPDYAGVRIVRKTDGYPTGPNDGTLIYQGTGTSFLDTSVVNGTTYYYGAYAYDFNGNFASGALASATPQAPPQPPTPTSPPPGPPPPQPPPPGPPPPGAPPVPAGPGVITGPPSPDATISVNLYGAGGTLPLAPGSDGWIGVLAGSNVLAEVPALSMNGTPGIVVFVVNGATYNLAYDPKTDSYRGKIPMPAAPGTYQAKVQAVFTDGRLAERTLTLRAQGGGVVVEKSLVGPELPIAGALVTLFVQQGGTWVPWNGAAYGQGNPIETGGNGGYVFEVSPGRYYAEVSKVGYEKAVTSPVFIDGNVFGLRVELIKIPPPVVSVISPTSTALENIVAVTQNLGEQAAYAAEKVSQFIESPEVQEAVETVIAPTVLVVTLLNVASFISLFNLLAFLQYLFTQPILLLGRRKRKRWGIAYNSLTKRPIDLVIVRLVHHETGLTVLTRVTDKQGRFAFDVKPGVYRIEAVKPGYVFPSQYVFGVKTDVDYVDVYHGEPLRAAEQAILTPNIPLDPIVAEETPRQVLLKKFLRRLQHAIALSGVAMSGAVLAISPSVPLAMLLVAQVAIYFMFRRLNLPAKPKNWGIVSASDSRRPVGRAIVRIFESKFNKLLETQLTDTAGRYAFLVRKNVYYITAEAPGFRPVRMPDIDLTRSEEGVIARNIALKPEDQTGKALGVRLRREGQATPPGSASAPPAPQAPTATPAPGTAPTPSLSKPTMPLAPTPAPPPALKSGPTPPRAGTAALPKPTPPSAPAIVPPAPPLTRAMPAAASQWPQLGKNGGAKKNKVSKKSSGNNSSGSVIQSPAKSKQRISKSSSASSMTDTEVTPAPAPSPTPTPTPGPTPSPTPGPTPTPSPTPTPTPVAPPEPTPVPSPEPLPTPSPEPGPTEPTPPGTV